MHEESPGSGGHWRPGHRDRAHRPDCRHLRRRHGSGSRRDPAEHHLRPDRRPAHRHLRDDADGQESVTRPRRQLPRHHPDVEIGQTTIGDFFTGRYRYAPDPEPGGWDPRLPESGLPRPLDWRAIFGRAGPVEIEVGSGKGGFLVEAATRFPDTGFLSIEWASAYAEGLRDRIRRRDLRNVRVVRAEAGWLLREVVPAGSVRAIHVYFPDPWPKKRHHKRRLVTPAFAGAVAEALEPDGELRFVTDHGEYFDQARAVLDAEPRLEEIDVPADMVDLTNYERKYRAEGWEPNRHFR